LITASEVISAVAKCGFKKARLYQFGWVGDIPKVVGKAEVQTQSTLSHEGDYTAPIVVDLAGAPSEVGASDAGSSDQDGSADGGDGDDGGGGDDDEPPLPPGGLGPIIAAALLTFTVVYSTCSFWGAVGA